MRTDGIVFTSPQVFTSLSPSSLKGHVLKWTEHRLGARQIWFSVLVLHTYLLRKLLAM